MPRMISRMQECRGVQSSSMIKILDHEHWDNSHENLYLASKYRQLNSHNSHQRTNSRPQRTVLYIYLLNVAKKIIKTTLTSMQLTQLAEQATKAKTAYWENNTSIALQAATFTRILLEIYN